MYLKMALATDTHNLQPGGEQLDAPCTPRTVRLLRLPRKVRSGLDNNINVKAKP